MDLKIFFTAFTVVFLAELGDKTQLAALSLAAESKAAVSVFMGSSAALVLSSLLAVTVGATIGKFIPANAVRIAAGVLFILIGGWMIFFSGSE